MPKYFKGRNFRGQKLSRFRVFWPFPRKFMSAKFPNNDYPQKFMSAKIPNNDHPRKFMFAKIFGKFIRKILCLSSTAQWCCLDRFEYLRKEEFQHFSHHPITNQRRLVGLANGSEETRLPIHSESEQIILQVLKIKYLNVTSS